jgi:CRISPR-associated protein Csm1
MALKRIKEFEDPNAYFTTLYYLLKKHTWSLPADNGTVIQDASLFDHLKTSSAIAACLSGFSGEELNRIALEWGYSGAMKGSRASFLLVCGDISGIGKFIYTITSKGAAKGLRGRSFYLQLLSESLAKFVLKELDLPLTCLLYCGGGHFYILAPVSDKQKLLNLRDSIAKSLLKIHRGDLFLAMGWTEIKPHDLKQDISRIWNEAAASANIEKQRKFASLAYEYYEDIFGPDPEEGAGSRDVCDICKEEGQLWFRGESSWLLWQGEEVESKLCHFCKQFEIIGGRLGSADYLVEIVGIDHECDEYLLFFFEDFNISFYAFPKEVCKSWKPKKEVRVANIYILNSTKFLADEDILALAVERGFGLGFKFIGNVTPIEGDSIKDFEGMARDAEGIKRMGLLRMDVDDLGRIFAEGLGKRATLSRVSTMSTLFSIFFDGYLNNICSRKKYTNNIYIIYSGGDDLFIVGSWNLIPEVASDIQRDFAQFVSRNPNLTISAGISIFERKYPLYRAAEEAHEGLEKAKGYNRAGTEKDAISFLSKELSWNEMALSAQMKDLLFRCLKGERNDTGSANSDSNQSSRASELPKSVLGRLAVIYSLYRQGRETLEKEEKSFGDLVRLASFERWRWIMTYSLHRAARQNKAFEDDLKQIEEALSRNRLGDLVSKERNVIEYLDVPVRWADFLTRKEEWE